MTHTSSDNITTLDLIINLQTLIKNLKPKNVSDQRRCTLVTRILTTLKAKEIVSKSVINNSLLKNKLLLWINSLSAENPQKYSSKTIQVLDDIISFHKKSQSSISSQFLTQRDIEILIDTKLESNIQQTVQTILQDQKTQLSSALNNSVRELEDTIKSAKEKINELQNGYIEAKKSTEYYNQLETKKIFYLQSEILSEKFNEKRNELKKQKIPYQWTAFLLTGILGILYILFFFIQHTGNNFDYINHITLICVCTPIIFFDIWLFYQVGRFNHLIEIYTHKANIGFTLKAATDHIHDIEGDDNNKSTTLTTLHELLNKLYESPISTKDHKSITTKSLSQITELLKEVKELVNTIKPTSDKTSNQ